MRRWALVATLVGVLVAAVAAALVVGGSARRSPREGVSVAGPGESSARPAPLGPLGPGGSRRGPSRAHEAATTALVRNLERALDEGNVPAARALAGPLVARRLTTAVTRNVARLDVEALDLWRVAEAPATPDLVRRFGAGTWVAEVQVEWRYAGVDERPVTSTIQLVLVPSGRRAALADTRPALGQQAPLWLLRPLSVERRDRVRVVASDAATASRLLPLAVGAFTDVERRMPAWRGPLVVEAPGSAAGFRAASGVVAAATDNIAAVTTTADGSALPGSPERVFLNPRVFEPLGSTGQRIVLSHEATHVAVDAAISPAPPWVSEGFADWVALADSPVPVRVLASQALADVRESGAPTRLPGRSAFAAGNPDLGAAYESAWLAVRLIAQRHGETALLRFQRVADRQGSVDRAFRVALGTSEEAFTRGWRRALLQLAG